MARCDKTMWGEKNTEEYSREMLTFFTVLNFTRVNKSPKEKQIKSTPQPPQFSKNSWAPGMAHLTFVSLRSGPLIDGLLGKRVLVEVLMLTLVAGVRERNMEHTGRNRQKKRERVLVTRSGV